MNLYKAILEENIPKLINLYNLDPAAKTNGYGDRLYWGWKVRDFCNATLQGGIHSLAIALNLDLIKQEAIILDLIDRAIQAIDTIKDKSNSVVEAYPNEQSFCVTALVAFDVLSTIDILKDKISDKKRSQYIEIIRPLIHFIENNDEEHAIISNHLATGVAAIAIWNKVSGSHSKRHESLLGIIFNHQSKEGWYREYEGSDPGYQTLCTYYLAVANRYLQNEELSSSLNKSLEFLEYFVQPDGSIGGLYGSRNTEVFYPGGLAILANENPIAKRILDGLGTGLSAQVHITPQIIDIGNYAPLVNSYAYAAWMQEDAKSSKQDFLPIHKNFEKSFEDAGIYICSTEKYYAIINYKKGGTLKVFDKEKKCVDLEDGGWIAKGRAKKWVSTQHVDQTITFKDQEIRSHFYANNEAYPSPFQFMIIRILSLTIFKSNRIGNLFKKSVVKLLMTGKSKVDGFVQRSFKFTEEKIEISETIKRPSSYPNLEQGGKFKSIHMASSGYNSHQLLNAQLRSKFVVFNIEYED